MWAYWPRSKLTRDGQHSGVVAKALSKLVPWGTRSLCLLRGVALSDYFKEQARRVFGALRGYNEKKSLLEDVAQFVAKEGGLWIGTATDNEVGRRRWRSPYPVRRSTGQTQRAMRNPPSPRRLTRGASYSPQPRRRIPRKVQDRFTLRATAWAAGPRS